ncbi:MAG: response regulator [Anaerolineae bacterium]|nr:response regulator [Anaerolineae bacterium]
MSEDEKPILIIEDNPDNRVLITDMLHSMGYQVIEAPDGDSGVRLAHQHRPALILMDLSLPSKDGWQATREIKNSPELAHIPVVALTAHAMRGDRERALEAGCDEYLTKPVSLGELSRTFSAVLGGRAAC